MLAQFMIWCVNSVQSPIHRPQTQAFLSLEKDYSKDNLAPAMRTTTASVTGVLARVAAFAVLQLRVVTVVPLLEQSAVRMRFSRVVARDVVGTISSARLVDVLILRKFHPLLVFGSEDRGRV